MFLIGLRGLAHFKARKSGPLEKVGFDPAHRRAPPGTPRKRTRSPFVLSLIASSIKKTTPRPTLGATVLPGFFLMPFTYGSPGVHLQTQVSEEDNHYRYTHERTPMRIRDDPRHRG